MTRYHLAPVELIRDSVSTEIPANVGRKLGTPITPTGRKMGPEVVPTG